MKHSKKTSIAGAFARKEDYEYEGQKFEADIKQGDIVTILSGAQIVNGEFGEQKVFSIKTRNGVKNFPFNQSTINVLVEDLGEDDDTWVGKDVIVLMQKAVVAGKKVLKTYMVTPNWKLDDYGELVKATAPEPTPSLDDVN